MRLILDTSIAIAWCFADETSTLSEAALTAVSSGGALVPSHFRLELANVIATCERTRRLSRAKAEHYLRLMDELPFEVDEETDRNALGDTLALARAHRLTSYDAAYLELATRTKLPLATSDKELKKAAVAAGVIIFSATDIS